MILFLLVAVGMLATVSVAFAGANLNYKAHLSGDEEVPVVETDGTGVANLKVSKTGDSLHFKLNVSNLADITQAHIHCGPEGVNGPVVAFLFGLVPAGVTEEGRLAEGTITDANVIARPNSAECPGGVSNLDDVLEKMQSGGAYVNVHTLAFPGGEARGQIH
jgi:hypothetical protein